MKLSYHVHHDSGKPGKTHYIARLQSFHGATLHGISVSELPILAFYEPLLPKGCAKIAQHNPSLGRRVGETMEEYAQRSAQDLEDKILEIGPGNVAAFIGETMLGSLVGDVPPAPGYWKSIRAVCDRYDVHLILDEIYCGLGRSGRAYCFDWDGITPDFVCVGKNLAAGYAPLSAVVTRHQVEEIIAKGQGRIQHGHTHQGYSLGVAAALAVQKIVQTDEMLAHVHARGRQIVETLTGKLGDHPFFKEVRGRGLLQSLEYDCPDKNAFGLLLAKRMLEEHNIFINAKWHRVSFTPGYIITEAQLAEVLETFVTVFKDTAKSWTAAG
jgi:adenosylmethionine-8-amino-7-oxononanoate aminotransferase